MTGTPKTTVLHFGAFEFDLEAGKLLKNGRMVRLQPQPFRLLCLLVSQPGRLVTREEIQAALWKDETFVDFEQGVNFAIKQVREALGDRAESSVYIQTVPGADTGSSHPWCPAIIRSCSYRPQLIRSCCERYGKTSSTSDSRKSDAAGR